MTANNNTEIAGLNNSHLSMETYDTLHPTVRKLLQDAPVNLSISPDKRGLDKDELTNLVKREIPKLVKILANEAYGPDHPQAQ